MKFSQLIKFSVRNISLQKSRRKHSKGTSSRPLFFLKKKLYNVQASGQHLSFNILVDLGLDIQ